MELNNCSNSTESVGELFRQLEEKSDMAMIPSVVILVIFSVVGLVGNILVLVVYSQKVRLSPTKVLIMTIASFDLMANVGAIPSEINIMMDTWTFNQPGVCKSKVFLGTVTTVGGAISLCIVAAIRYRKVCRPYGWQVTIRHSIIASIVTAIVAFLFSIPYIIIYGIRTRDTPCQNIKGHECFASDVYFYTIWPFLNNVLFILLYISLSVTMVVLYVFIGVTAYKHSKIHGVSGGVITAEKNTNSSCEGLSASDDPNVSLERLDNPQPRNWPSRIKTDIIRRASAQILDCCRGNQDNEKTDDETPSSIHMKNYTTSSDTVTGDKTMESITTDLDVVTTEGSANAECVDNDSQHLDLVGLKLTDSPDGYQNNEVCQPSQTSGASEDCRPHSYHLAVSQDHKHIKEGQDTPSKEFHQKNTVGVNRLKTKPLPPSKKGANRRPLGRMTAMLIIISAIFVLGYLPFLIMTIVKNRLPEFYANLTLAELAVFNFFYRLYFLNSAANPIVYSFCDLNFKRECIRLLTCKFRRHL